MSRPAYVDPFTAPKAAALLNTAQGVGKAESPLFLRSSSQSLDFLSTVSVDLCKKGTDLGAALPLNFTNIATGTHHHGYPARACDATFE